MNQNNHLIKDANIFDSAEYTRLCTIPKIQLQREIQSWETEKWKVSSSGSRRLLAARVILLRHGCIKRLMRKKNTYHAAEGRAARPVYGWLDIQSKSYGLAEHGLLETQISLIDRFTLKRYQEPVFHVICSEEYDLRAHGLTCPHCKKYAPQTELLQSELLQELMKISDAASVKISR